MHKSDNEIVDKIVFMSPKIEQKWNLNVFWEVVSHFFFDMTFRIFLFEFYHQDRDDKKQNRKSFPEFNNGKKSLWPFFKDGVQLPQG